MPRDLFSEDVQAYRVIRDYAASAATLETDALHWAIQDGVDEGQSVRQSASLLRVSASVVHRHRRERPVRAANSWGEKVHHYECRRLPKYQGSESTRSKLVNQCTLQSWAERFTHMRRISDAARAWESALLRMSVIDGTDQGISIRQVASHLGVPHATAARRRLATEDYPPVWATALTYSSVETLGWAHAPHRIEGRVPYEWVDHSDGSRSVSLIPQGGAVLN